MDAISLLQRLHQHRIWANGNLLTAAAKLSPQQLQAQFQIGQGSLWKSLLHMYAAEYVWLETLLGNEQAIAPGDALGKLPGNQEGTGRITDLAELRQRWSDLDARWNAYLESLKQAALEDEVYRTRIVDGKPVRYEVRRCDALLHICTHAHYTAAQMVNMFRQTGVEKLPEVMLDGDGPFRADVKRRDIADSKWRLQRSLAATKRGMSPFDCSPTQEPSCHKARQRATRRAERRSTQTPRIGHAAAGQRDERTTAVCRVRGKVGP